MGENLFVVGTGVTDITPPRGVPYLGIRPRHPGCSGVHDPLHARAMIVGNGLSSVAIISAELIGLINTVLGPTRNFTEEVRDLVARRTGIPGSAVMLSCVHAHSTPDSIDIRPLRENRMARAWLETLAGLVTDSVVLAMKNRFDARMKTGSAKVQGLARNRRGNNSLDEEMSVLMFESPDRSRAILLAHFACHPVIVQVQDQVSADFPGAFSSSMEKHFPEVKGCLFLQGACGDIDPCAGCTGNFKDVARAATLLEEHAARLLTAMGSNDYPMEPVLVSHASEALLLPSRPLPEESSIRREVETLKDALREAKDGPSQTTIEGKIIMAEEALCRVLEGAKPFPAEVQCFRLGNALLTGIPGEPFCRMGLSIKEESSPLLGIPVGYANGYVGYIAPRDEWNAPGYELAPGPWSKVGPESFDMLLDAFRRLKATLTFPENRK